MYLYFYFLDTATATTAGLGLNNIPGMPAGFQLPAGNPLLDSLGAMLSQPGLRETFQQFVQDPALQGLVRQVAGSMGTPAGDINQITGQIQSHLENNHSVIFDSINQHILGHLDVLAPPGENGGNDDSTQPPPSSQPPPQP